MAGGLWAVCIIGFRRKNFSPPVSLSLSFIEKFVLLFGNDNYRDRYRLSTFSAVVVVRVPIYTTCSGDALCTNMMTQHQPPRHHRQGEELFMAEGSLFACSRLRL